MSRIIAQGLAGFMQLLRSRVYLNVIVAGVFLTACALIFEQLAGGTGGRVLLEVGLAFIALTTAALAGIIAITSMTREIETKQIHLVLARPVARYEVLLGRFTTIALLVIATNVVLGGVLATLILATGNDGAMGAFVAAQFASFESLIVGAIALFFGVGSSSTMSALFTTTIFVLGRLTLPLWEVLQSGRFEGAMKSVLTGAYWVLPHFSAFDATEWARTGKTFDWLGNGIYGVLLLAGLVALAAFRLERRDVL